MGLALMREKFRGNHHKHFQYIPQLAEYSMGGWRLIFHVAFIFGNGEPDMREVVADVYTDLTNFCYGFADRTFEVKISGGMQLTIECEIQGRHEP
jgi:hypothetical protein